jgi:hypothetical protein
MSYWRLIKAFWRSIPRTYVLWQMNEASDGGKTLYSCATCGMARTEPCEHWQNGGIEFGVDADDAEMEEKKS